MYNKRLGMVPRYTGYVPRKSSFLLQSLAFKYLQPSYTGKMISPGTYCYWNKQSKIICRTFKLHVVSFFRIPIWFWKYVWWCIAESPCLLWYTRLCDRRLQQQRANYRANCYSSSNLDLDNNFLELMVDAEDGASKERHFAKLEHLQG